MNQDACSCARLTMITLGVSNMPPVSPLRALVSRENFAHRRDCCVLETGHAHRLSVDQLAQTDAAEHPRRSFRGGRWPELPHDG